MGFKVSPSSVPTRHWLFYIAGFLGILLINNALLTMLIYRYDPGIPNPENLPFLVSSAFVGVAIFISRILGAIAQPMIGYASDRLQSPWGQRRPFLAMAILPLAASFILLFTPPQTINGRVTLFYLVILLSLFYLAFAAYQVPYLAWLSTLAPNAEQKVTLSTWLAAAGLTGSAIGAVGAPWLSQKYGFYGMALMLGSVGFVSLLLPLRVPEQLRPSHDHHPPFWQSLRLGWHNSAFRIYIAGIAAAWIAVSIVSVCPTFLAVALLHRDVSFGGVINGVILGGTVIGFIPVSLLARHWGKGQTFQRSMIWLGCGLVTISVMPFFVGTTLPPWLALLLIGNLGAASFFILPNAMLPDVISHGAKDQGIGQEAIYFGTRGLLVEISIGFGSLLAGLILALGKTSEQPWGVQLAFPIAGIFALAAAGAFIFYPIER